MPTVIAYLRVSTIDQDLEKNKNDILRLANEKNLWKVFFVEEKISGTVTRKKRKIGAIIQEQLGEWDTLLLSELSRIGRSMLEIMQVISIALEKGIHIYTVKGRRQLDNTLQSKIMAMVFSMAAEIERDLISKRTKEALRARKAAWMKLGRPKGPGKSKLDKFRPEIEALMQNGSTQAFIAKRYNVMPATLSNRLLKHGLRRSTPPTLPKNAQ